MSLKSRLRRLERDFAALPDGAARPPIINPIFVTTYSDESKTEAQARIEAAEAEARTAGKWLVHISAERL